jgi:hypothetical protein
VNVIRAQWAQAWFEFIEEEQPIELPAKPTRSQKDEELNYGRTDRNKIGPAYGPGVDGE